MPSLRVFSYRRLASFLLSLFFGFVSSAPAAQLMFTSQAHFLAGDGKAALEQNSLTLGPAVPGERFLFVSDPPDDPLFNGNNIVGTLYAVDADNQIIGVYYGEISRLLKSGSNVIACQFYVYGPGEVLPPSNSSPPQQTIMINISANLFEGLSIKTSSDPVDKALNKLLPPNVAPVAELDTDSAFMPSCSLSQEQGTATGNVITGVGSDGNPDGADTDENIVYTFDPDKILTKPLWISGTRLYK
jgi:hypothetical protein